MSLPDATPAYRPAPCYDAERVFRRSPSGSNRLSSTFQRNISRRSRLRRTARPPNFRRRQQPQQDDEQGRQRNAAVLPALLWRWWRRWRPSVRSAGGNPQRCARLRCCRGQERIYSHQQTTSWTRLRASRSSSPTTLPTIRQPWSEPTPIQISR